MNDQVTTSSLVSPSTKVRLTFKFAHGMMSLTLAIVGLSAKFGKPCRPSVNKSALAIESGIQGWQLLEYEELFLSASEYLGAGRVHKIVINERKKYLKQVQSLISRGQFTHYFYDPRTGSQGNIRAIFEAIYLSILLHWKGIIPIARLSDVPVRRWRLQCSIITASQGLCLTMMSNEQVRRLFPHNRFLGPLPMALSKDTLTKLQDLRRGRARTTMVRPIFTGSLYEPRTSTLLAIKDGLSERGITFEIQSRELGTDRDSNLDYWGRILAAEIIVTTAMPRQATSGEDDIAYPHLLYRYTEALAAGALLVAPAIPNAESYFMAGIHYVDYSTVDDAVDKIEKLVNDGELRAKITRSGANRMRELVETNAYWRAIDGTLGNQGLGASEQ